MPNHVTTYVCSDNFQALWKLRDFNLITPMPVILSKTTHGSDAAIFSTLLAQGCNLAEIKKQVPRFNTIEKWERMVMRYAYCKRMYGCVSWYEWATKNWDTKWNAYNITAYHEHNEIWFDTAWNHPTAVIEALSCQYPDDVFEVWFADEDIGYNAGRYTIQNGKYLVNDDIANDSKEAFEIAFFIHGHDDEYRWCDKEQTYVCIED